MRRGGLPFDPATRRAASSRLAFMPADRLLADVDPHGPLTPMPAGPIASSTPCSISLASSDLGSVRTRASAPAARPISRRSPSRIGSDWVATPGCATSRRRSGSGPCQRHHIASVAALALWSRRQVRVLETHRVLRRARRCCSRCGRRSELWDAVRARGARRAVTTSRPHRSTTCLRMCGAAADRRTWIPTRRARALLAALTLAGLVAAVRALGAARCLRGADRSGAAACAPPFRDAAAFASPSILAAFGATWAIACAARYAREQGSTRRRDRRARRVRVRHRQHAVARRRVRLVVARGYGAAAPGECSRCASARSGPSWSSCGSTSHGSLPGAIGSLAAAIAASGHGAATSSSAQACSASASARSPDCRTHVGSPRSCSRWCARNHLR